MTTAETALYHCRDCLTAFTARQDLHPGDEFCEPCMEAMAEQIAIARVRQLNLEDMGSSPDELEVDGGAPLWSLAGRPTLRLVTE